MISNASNLLDHSLHVIHLIFSQQLHCCCSFMANDRLMSIKVQCIYASHFIDLFPCIWSVVWTCHIIKVITESNHPPPFQQCFVMSYKFLWTSVSDASPYIKDVILSHYQHKHAIMLNDILSFELSISKLITQPPSLVSMYDITTLENVFLNVIWSQYLMAIKTINWSTIKFPWK